MQQLSWLWTPGLAGLGATLMGLSIYLISDRSWRAVLFVGLFAVGLAMYNTSLTRSTADQLLRDLNKVHWRNVCTESI